MSQGKTCQVSSLKTFPSCFWYSDAEDAACLRARHAKCLPDRLNNVINKRTPARINAHTENMKGMKKSKGVAKIYRHTTQENR